MNLMAVSLLDILSIICSIKFLETVSFSIISSLFFKNEVYLTYYMMYDSDASIKSLGILYYSILFTACQPFFEKNLPAEPVRRQRFSGVPEVIRTPGLPLRRRSLYPAELLEHHRDGVMKPPVSFCMPLLVWLMPLRRTVPDKPALRPGVPCPG